MSLELNLSMSLFDRGLFEMEFGSCSNLDGHDLLKLRKSENLSK